MKKNRFLMAATRLAAATLTLVVIPMLAIAAGAAGTEKVLYEFTGGADGASPRHSLIFDANGALYGTTFYGGAYGAGTVYALTPNSDGSWTEKVLYSFSGGVDGGYPDWGSLTFDSAGDLYGVTYGGGQHGVGTIYELTPNSDGTWTEHALHQFTGGKDGAQPRTKTIFDAQGNFYAVASYGGADGCGDVFKMTSGSNNTWTFSVIHQFMGKPGCAPWVGLIADASGNFYGTTRNQLLGCSNPPQDCGTVFELTPGSGGKWTYEVIHKFSGGKGGSEPVFGLIFGEDGALYGAARTEGAYSAGLFYKLTPAEGKWSYQVLHQFKENKDGDLSEGVLVRDASGNLYGTAGFGGLYGNGTLYEMAPGPNNTWTFSVLHNFGGSGDGAAAIPGPISDAAGNLYGVTPNGGTYGAGMVYEITP